MVVVFVAAHMPRFIANILELTYKLNFPKVSFQNNYNDPLNTNTDKVISDVDIFTVNKIFLVKNANSEKEH